MSLVTRCPSCTTTFKVVRDQLRISDGWVRCGRCSHVFDATLDLHETPDTVLTGTTHAPPVMVPPPPVHAPVSFPQSEIAAPEAPEPPLPEDAAADETPAPESAPPPPPPVHGIAADDLWTDVEAIEPEWRPPPSTLPPFPDIDLNIAVRPSPPAPPASPSPSPLPALRMEARDMAAPTGDGEHEDADAASPDRDRIQSQKVLRRARAKPADGAPLAMREERERRDAEEDPAAAMVREASEADPVLSAQPVEVDDLESERPSFLADEVPKQEAGRYWQRAGVRWSLACLAVLAVVLLAVQVLRHERNGIAARQPGLRPALVSLCQWTGCEVTALRQIRDIVIEGAAFARERSGGNDYRLSFTLRNGATVPLATPAVELSLLDSQERAVVRRVLTATEYGAPAVLAARADQSASLPLTLSAPETATLPTIAGYRVEAFYP